MARYIDADRLKRTFASGIRVYDGRCTIYDVLHNIENEPAADVVEVPCRCKECEHRKNGIQGSYCGLTDFMIKDDDFCSYGERRDTE